MSTLLRLNWILLLFYSAMFKNSSVLVGEKNYPLKRLRKMGTRDYPLRYFDYNNLLLIEQNPFTGSSFAKQAQQGKKIMWVLGHEIDHKREYLARVSDGQVKWLKRKTL